VQEQLDKLAGQGSREVKDLRDSRDLKEPLVFQDGLVEQVAKVLPEPLALQVR